MFNLRKGDFGKLQGIRKTSNQPREILRAHALVLKFKNFTHAEIADILDITARTVSNVVENYRDGGIDKAIQDDPRPGPTPKFDDGIQARVVAIVCSDPPEGFDRWTLELLQDEVVRQEIVDSISKESIRIILREHDLKPWQQKMWCIPKLDDEYIIRMEDILEVYERPVDQKYPVVCVDEKSVILEGDTRAPIAMEAGSPKKVDYEYSRHGMANVFCAVEPKSGKYFNTVSEKKDGAAFSKFIIELIELYPEAEKLVLIMDNYCTHFEKSLLTHCGPELGALIWKKLEVHYTPIHASWLNQAEIAIGMFDRQCLGTARIADVETLTKKTQAWNRATNRKNPTIEWSFTRAAAREKFKYDGKN